MAGPGWYKGNIHTHTTESDGDESPEKVVDWYRRYGYDWLVLSDHDHLTLLDHGSGRRRFQRPLLIPGEEVSAQIKGDTVSVHITAIGISRVVEPIDAGEVVPTIQANVDAVLEAGGITSINHPNFQWSFDHEQIKQVTGASLLEVYNGNPGTNAYAAPGRFSTEQIWDEVLTAGRVIFGVATDDSHHYHDFHPPSMANPGRGWVNVRANELSEDAIIQALETGEFYASSGVTLSELELSRDSIGLSIEPEPDPISVTRFIGRSGRVLDAQVGLQACYRIRGDEGYVRAQVTDTRGMKAWTQPVFLGG